MIFEHFKYISGAAPGEVDQSSNSSKTLSEPAQSCNANPADFQHDNSPPPLELASIYNSHEENNDAGNPPQLSENFTANETEQDGEFASCIATSFKFDTESPQQQGQLANCMDSSGSTAHYSTSNNVSPNSAVLSDFSHQSTVLVCSEDSGSANGEKSPTLSTVYTELHPPQSNCANDNQEGDAVAAVAKEDAKESGEGKSTETDALRQGYQLFLEHLYFTVRDWKKANLQLLSKLFRIEWLKS